MKFLKNIDLKYLNFENFLSNLIENKWNPNKFRYFLIHFPKIRILMNSY